ncbi:NAD(P)/FAD-dependent oxidoreductase [Clostridium cylindrosporum]|uniref:Nitrite reductase n=1 Tax=Clostridium cylindrosporum DSM 605 TaxID=1121307 RepID=A0A0J8G037_CLOCY|nr:FAD-dependent oxidoreductase [Clostridium cylindrosporum]KMT21166.1 nitrite reductase [Clostridium cylindrosporum DSM 605]
MASRIVIIGNGIASITAIKAIREVDLDSEIYLIGEEKFYPYNRIRLSKGMLDDIEENNILLQKKEWYEENKVKIYINTKVVSVDIDNKEVLLSDATSIKYDKLLFANGSSNRVPPIDGINKVGVHTIRTLDNVLGIKDNLNKAEQIIIIGGGIQGLETAWILHKSGKKVIVVELLSRLMPRELDDKASEILKKIIIDHGIQILTSSSVKQILGDSKVEGILVDEKSEIKGDIVIYSTGISPNIELVSNTKIKAKRGIVVNNKMETTIENIYAAGDVAEFNDKVTGLWNIAIAQGKVAGYNIVGKEIAYEDITPVVTLNAFDISLFSMGCIDETNSTKVLLDENVNNTEYKKIFIKNNKIVGAIVIGDTRKSPLIKSAIEKEILLDEFDLSNVSVDELLNKLKK